MTHRFRVRPLLPLLLLLAAHSSPAQNSVFSGVEISPDSNHAYIGTLYRPAPESVWRTRFWLDRTRYEYDKAGATVNARATGLEAAIGIGGESGASWWAAYLGPRHERTTLTPDDRSNDNRGSHTRVKLQGEAESGLGGAWRLNAGAAYLFVSEKYWLRGRLFHPVAPRSVAGVELVRHGGNDYAATQFGGIYSIPLGAQSSLLFKGGLRHDESRGSSGYGGVELSLPY